MRPAFIDREGTLGRVVAGVKTHSLVLLSGEAGIGKSRLVAELEDEADVLLGRCHRLRDPFPLGPMVQVLRGLRGTAALRDLPASAGALRLLVPELSGSLPELPKDSGDPHLLRHLMFRGIEAALHAAAPAVLVIEDAHWIDEQTLEFLDFLVSDPIPGLAIVVTFRDTEVDPAVPALAARAAETLPVSRVTVSRWDAEGTGQLAAGMLGLKSVSGEFAEHLWRRSSGLPLAIRELLGALVEQGTIAMQDGEWVRRSIGELEVPAGLRDPVLERMARLGEGARSLVEAAAVLQRPVERSVLSATAAVRGSALTQAILEAEASGLLVEGEAGYEVSHTLSSEAVYGDLATVRREVLHGRAAAALRSALPWPLARIAHHEREAGNATWPGTALAAGDQAEALGDFEAVITALEPLLTEISVSSEKRARVVLALSRASVLSHRGLHLLALFDSEVAREQGCLSPDTRVRVASNASQLLDNQLCDATPRSDLTALARRPGVTAEAGLTAEAIALTRWLPGRATSEIDAALPSLEKRVRDAELDPDRRRQLDMMLDEARLLAGLSSPSQLQAERVFASAADQTTFIGHTNLAEIAAPMGALGFASDLLDLSEGVNDPGIAPQSVRERVTVSRRLVEYYSGQWNDLLTSDGLPREPVSRMPLLRLKDEARSASLLVALKGSTDAAVEDLNRILRLAASGSQQDVLALALPPRIRAAIARGETADVPGVERFLAAVPDEAAIPCLYLALPAVVSLLLARGENERAERTAESFADQARAIHAEMAPTAIAHARGLLALAAEPHTNHAAELLCAAADTYDDVPMPYEAAHVREQAAGALAVTDPEAAEELLTRAIVAFRDLGASSDFDRARATGRRMGWSVPGSPRVGRPAYGDNLSPREREVAALAAQGLTNEEIGQRLYVSVHTVRKHVAAALHKLGVDSRRQLSGRLAVEPDEHLGGP